ncbi:hypothetical protein MtrunA17_Chr1g0194811 [Medicago truncatula]|uniref:Uncharacterized protein n=1 Tax=Medicago truncatula TaxID=3880 RepID=A0A396JRW9_MEDTR|nr:hypothetical protein MtrunA17_Chr1g0194811 [Medicago truncatula]
MGLAKSSISKNQTDSTLNENTSPFPDEVLKNMPHIQEGDLFMIAIFEFNTHVTRHICHSNYLELMQLE